MAAEIELKKINEYVSDLVAVTEVTGAYVYGINSSGASIKIAVATIAAQGTDYSAQISELTLKCNNNTTLIKALQSAVNGKAAANHTHSIANVQGLQNALDGKSNTGHTHSIANVQGLQDALDGKAAANHTHSIANVQGLQDALDGKAAANHTHAIANVQGLQAALDGKAAANHTHSIANVQGLQNALTGINGDIADAQQDITDAQRDITDLNTSVNTITSNVTTLTNNVTTAQKDITDLNTRVTSAETDIADNTSNIATLQTDVEGKSDKGHTHEMSDVEGLTATLQDHGDRITALEEQDDDGEFGNYLRQVEDLDAHTPTAGQIVQYVGDDSGLNNGHFYKSTGSNKLEIHAGETYYKITAADGRVLYGKGESAGEMLYEPVALKNAGDSGVNYVTFFPNTLFVQNPDAQTRQVLYDTYRELDGDFDFDNYKLYAFQIYGNEVCPLLYNMSFPDEEYFEEWLSRDSVKRMDMSQQIYGIEKEYDIDDETGDPLDTYTTKELSLTVQNTGSNVRLSTYPSIFLDSSGKRYYMFDNIPVFTPALTYIGYVVCEESIKEDTYHGGVDARRTIIPCQQPIFYGNSTYETLTATEDFTVGVDSWQRWDVQSRTTVASGDAFLTLTNDILGASIDIAYNSANQHLELKGNGGAVVSYVDMGIFIKDGMLDNVELFTTAEQGVSVQTPYLKFTFNTASGKSVIRVSLHDLVDVYDGANINLTSAFVKAATYSAPAIGDSMDVAVGKLLKGHEDNAAAIETKQATITGAATSITTANLTASKALVSDANGKVAASSVTATELGYVAGVTSAIQTQFGHKVDKVAGKGLSTNDYTTADKDKLAGIEANANNYSLPTASASTKGGVKVGTNLSIDGSGVLSANDTTYDAATQSADGLMSSTDKVKLDGIEQGANKTEFDDAPTAGSDKAVKSGGIKTALDGKASATQGGYADSALQTVTASGSGYVTLKAAAKAGNNGAKTQALSASLTMQALSTADAQHQGLAEASDVKAALNSVAAGGLKLVDLTIYQGQQGEIVKHDGPDTALYTNGYDYKCVAGGGSLPSDMLCIKLNGTITQNPDEADVLTLIGNDKIFVRTSDAPPLYHTSSGYSIYIGSKTAPEVGDAVVGTNSNYWMGRVTQVVSATEPFSVIISGGRIVQDGSYNATDCVFENSSGIKILSLTTYSDSHKTYPETETGVSFFVMYNDTLYKITPESAWIGSTDDVELPPSWQQWNSQPPVDISGKQDTLTFDDVPTDGSSNPVTSAGIKTAIDAVAQSAAQGLKCVDLSTYQGTTTGEIVKHIGPTTAQYVNNYEYKYNSTSSSAPALTLTDVDVSLSDLVPASQTDADVWTSLRTPFYINNRTDEGDSNVNYLVFLSDSESIDDKNAIMVGYNLDTENPTVQVGDWVYIDVDYSVPLIPDQIVSINGTKFTTESGRVYDTTSFDWSNNFYWLINEDGEEVVMYDSPRYDDGTTATELFIYPKLHLSDSVTFTVTRYDPAITVTISSTTTTSSWVQTDAQPRAVYTAGTGLKLSNNQFSLNVPRVTRTANSLPGTNTAIFEEYSSGDNYDLPSNALYHILTMQGNDTTAATQLALCVNNDAGVYYRRMTSSIWQPWICLNPTMDSTPTAGNTSNVVSSAGVKTYVDNAVSAKQVLLSEADYTALATKDPDVIYYTY